MAADLVLIAVAGGAGALARYGLGGLVQRLTGFGFPWGTMAVNLAGCLAFGLFWALAEERLGLGPRARLMVLTGFMGSFTTMSTFIFETGMLLRDGQMLMAALNLVGQNLVGLMALAAGMMLARAW